MLVSTLISPWGWQWQDNWWHQCWQQRTSDNLVMLYRHWVHLGAIVHPLNLFAHHGCHNQIWLWRCNMLPQHISWQLLAAVSGLWSGSSGAMTRRCCFWWTRGLLRLQQRPALISSRTSCLCGGFNAMGVQPSRTTQLGSYAYKAQLSLPVHLSLVCFCFGSLVIEVKFVRKHKYRYLR